MASGRARFALVFAAYLVLAVVATWPLAAVATDHVYGSPDGSPPLNIWAMGWVLHQLPRDPLHLFDGNVFYPYRDTLAFSEHLFVPALLAVPFLAATGNLLLAYNLVEIVTLAIAGFGMFLLARELTADDAASFAAGLLYAFHTWNINEMSRIQILSNNWFPFVLLAAVRFFRNPTWTRAAPFALTFVLQSLSGMYWALYLPLFLGFSLMPLQWHHRLPWRALARVAVALAVGLVCVMPFWWPYLATSRDLGFARLPPDSISYRRYFDVLAGNWFYGGWLGTARTGGQDAAHFLGFLPLALGLLGLVRGRFVRPVSLGRPFFLSLAIVGFLMSLGPTLLGDGWKMRGPYAFLYNFVPGFRNVRYPERFSVFVVLALAPVMAAGIVTLKSWLASRTLRTLVAGSIAAAVFLEHLSMPHHYAALVPPNRLPSVYHWLAGQPTGTVVAEWPAERNLLDRFDAIPMYNSIAHWQPTIQGYTGYYPPSYQFTRWRLFHLPDEESFRFLEMLGADTLVIRPGEPFDTAALGPHRRVIATFPEGHRVIRLDAAAGRTFPRPRQAAVGLVELDRAGWVVRSSPSGAARTVDGDPATSWSTVEAQRRDQYIRIRLDRVSRIARITLTIPSPSNFPMRLRVIGERPNGERIEMPFDEPAAYEGLFSTLLYEPSVARIDLDLREPPDIVGFRVEIARWDPFYMPWDVGEVRAFESLAADASGRVPLGEQPAEPDASPARLRTPR